MYMHSQWNSTTICIPYSSVSCWRNASREDSKGTYIITSFTDTHLCFTPVPLCFTLVITQPEQTNHKIEVLMTELGMYAVWSKSTKHVRINALRAEGALYIIHTATINLIILKFCHYISTNTFKENLRNSHDIDVEYTVTVIISMHWCILDIVNPCPELDFSLHIWGNKNMVITQSITTIQGLRVDETELMWIRVECVRSWEWSLLGSRVYLLIIQVFKTNMKCITCDFCKYESSERNGQYQGILRL